MWADSITRLILSPDDRAEELQARIDDYLNFGVHYLWIINPRTQHGIIHTAAGSYEPKDGILRTQDPVIEGPPAELFRELHAGRRI